MSFEKTKFDEGMLFTHRGLSGPSILQISSYWKLGKEIKINLSPNRNIFNFLQEKKEINPKQEIVSIINELIPRTFSNNDL